MGDPLQESKFYELHFAQPQVTINTSFILLYPGAASEASVQLTEKHFKKTKIRVVTDGKISGAKMLKEDIMGRLGASYRKYAIEFPGANLFSKMPADTQDKFQQVFKTTLAHECKQGNVYNCIEAMKKFNINSKELSRRYYSGEVLHLTGHTHISKFSNECFLVNGDFALRRDVLEDPNAKMHYFVVEWDQGEMKYSEVIEKYIGDQDASKAKAGTLRELIDSKYKQLDLPERPRILGSGVHFSVSPLEALHERIAFLGYHFDDDPYGYDIKAICGDRGVQLVKQWFNNNRLTLNNEPYRPVFDIVRDFSSSTLLDMIYQNLQNDGAFLKHWNEHRARRKATINEAQDAGDVYTDAAFRKLADPFKLDWTRLVDLFPRKPRSELITPKSLEAECNPGPLYTSSASLLPMFASCPTIMDTVFASKNVRNDGKYTFRMFRDADWEEVSIDDGVPVLDGRPAFVNSTEWWAHLLQHAYAKFRGGFNNIQAVSAAEMMRDLTSQPVESVFFRDDCIAASKVNPRPVAYWSDMATKIESQDVLVAALTPPNWDERVMGLKAGQAYWLKRVVVTPRQEVFLHLRTPPDLEYRGPYNARDAQWNDRTRKEIPQLGVKGNAHIPLSVALDRLQGLVVCYLRGYAKLQTVFTSQWAGCGNPSLTSWRNNAAFIVENRQREPVTIFAVASQSQQSGEKPRYVPAAVQVAFTRPSVVNPIETKLLTPNVTVLQSRGVYLEQRDVCGHAVLPGQSYAYVVPSTLRESDKGVYFLTIYAPKDLGRHVRARYLDIKAESHIRHEFQISPETRVKFAIQAEVVDDGKEETTTGIHILVHQKGPNDPNSEGNVATLCDVNVSLYDTKLSRIGGTPEVMNCRESCCAAAIPGTGQYYCIVSCTKSEEASVQCTAHFITSSKLKIEVLPPTTEKFVPEYERNQELEEW